jgi:predicted type IV restriction endonuclease
LDGSKEFIVQNQNDTTTRPVQIDAPSEAAPESTTETVETITLTEEHWNIAVSVLLSQAASLCVQHGVEVEAFMNGAWSAYVEARPGMRDQLEEAQLRGQLDELRRLGRMGAA